MITERKALWQEAFGDPADFVEQFFQIAYAPSHSQCITLGGKLAAALYWFDCSCNGAPMAYLYAVATAAAHRGEGLCRRLMAQTHAELKSRGYAGCILVPGSPELQSMYEKFGYRTCSYVQEVTCRAGVSLPMTRLNTAQYAALRREHLPAGGVLQEGTGLAFLSQFARFYQGDGFLLAATVEKGRAQVHELLGNADPARVIAGLGATEGTVRMPGNTRPFAMYYPLNSNTAPHYFALAFD